MNEYYGAHISTIEKINQLLSLPATGSEQDWEFELSDPLKVPQILKHLKFDESLRDEDKLALSLLMIASLDEMGADLCLKDNNVKEFNLFLKSNKNIFNKMKFFWVDLSKINNEKLKEFLFFS